MRGLRQSGASISAFLGLGFGSSSSSGSGSGSGGEFSDGNGHGGGGGGDGGGGDGGRGEDGDDDGLSSTSTAAAAVKVDPVAVLNLGQVSFEVSLRVSKRWRVCAPRARGGAGNRGDGGGAPICRLPQSFRPPIVHLFRDGEPFLLLIKTPPTLERSLRFFHRMHFFFSRVLR